MSEVSADNNVHGCGLTNRILVKTAILVSLKDGRSELGEETLLLVSDRDEVDGLGGERIHGTLVDTSNPHKDEISEFLGVAEVSIINELHQQENVEEDLALSDLRNLSSSVSCTVELVLNVLTSTKGRGLARKLETLVKVRQVILDDKDCVAEIIELSELFELFG